MNKLPSTLMGFAVPLAVLAFALTTQPAAAQSAAQPCTATGPDAVPDKVSPDLRAGPHTIVINGVRLWYCVAGKAGANAPPVVFLHGGPGEGSNSFATLAGPALEPALRMVYLDQRGSGRSERPWNNSYSIDVLVDDIEQLRRAWGAPSIALIGHSVGTILAVEYAARYPEHVSRMVLTAAAADVPATFNIQCDRLARANPDAYARAVEAVVPGSNRKCNVYADDIFRDDGLQAFVNGNMFPDPKIEALVSRADNAGGLRNTGEMSGAMIKDGLLEYRFARTSRLTMPTLIIAGVEDHQANVEPQRALATSLPNGRIIEYPGAGHFMWAENPQRFASDVVAFLNAGKSRDQRGSGGRDP